ncbi:hypothetical protein [Psychrobacter sp. W2-37-MNA-CIBAN-0211]|uniref:hypothetical protein n=1 Tax=Psychrobacter sp. W2-37-MNA-CIBAN-0211 TaxID=3140443 RepID=UPI003317B716
MTGIYYTTKDVQFLFKWKHADTIKNRINKGKFPEPHLEGRPNKWLKVTIDAMLEGEVEA